LNGKHFPRALHDAHSDHPDGAASIILKSRKRPLHSGNPARSCIQQMQPQNPLLQLHLCRTYKQRFKPRCVFHQNRTSIRPMLPTPHLGASPAPLNCIKCPSKAWPN